MKTLLNVDASARYDTSLSRQVTQYIADSLAVNTNHRDLASTRLEFVSEAHIGAYYTRAEERSDPQKETLALSDELITELKDASQLVIGAPMYNFSIPASLKAWIDLVCRVGETFRYGDNGPEGLLNIDRAFIVVATGGTPVGGEVDFVSPYLVQVCRFMGIENIHIIDVSGSKGEPEKLLADAKQQVDRVLETL
ncbi:FMN-dependent NADH-azoreductase [Eionea flava]